MRRVCVILAEDQRDALGHVAGFAIEQEAERNAEARRGREEPLIDDDTLAKATSALAAIAAGEPAPHPDVLRALRATLHRLPGGHRSELQRDVGRMSSDGAGALLSILAHLTQQINSLRRWPRGRF